MKKNFKILIASLSLTTSILYTLNIFQTEQKVYQSFIHDDLLNKIVSNQQIQYTDFISPSITSTEQESILYYGRVLKYYYANSIKVDDEDIKKLESYFESFSAADKAFAIQNLLSTTINISIYGSSSDAEFFAEAFSKWLNTPDKQKNKSWEITNAFFIEIFPDILKQGGVLEDTQQNIVDIVNKKIHTESSVIYDTTLKSIDIDSKSVNLKYSSSIENYWIGTKQNGTGALDYISKQFSSQNSFAFKNAYSVVQNWMYDSYTPASLESIASFKAFNKNKYSNFEALDAKLSLVSTANDGVSRLPFKKIYDALEETYLKQIPKSSIDFEQWTYADTQKLKELTLFLYNMLFSLISNDSWVENLLTGFIVSPDFPLKSTKAKNMQNVMGNTITTSKTSSTQKSNQGAEYSYIVLTGVSLTYKEFNSQYKMGFWSSPAKFNTLIHEFGHALDAFGSKQISARSKNYKKDIYYKKMYSGNIFGDYIPTFDFTFQFWKDPSSIIIIGVIGIVSVVSITYLTLNYKSRKKKDKED
ncbi:hypothetical protein EELLY_v1c02630 [Entomoplasma ellychniae]|uniref:Uncharacterized protein n=1 Tax=Entomoplasma ellychniae TaxID=2114 RepID=A0A8E2QYL2_9MOLU|nr:hypothetical protein [Entomoplasma ellychniae]PPE04583.1 hypothetical protein EELLY_v1c02630 [Entomoplasma ellychniae]